MKTVHRYLDAYDQEGETRPAHIGVLLLHVGGLDALEHFDAHHLALWSDPAVTPGLKPLRVRKVRKHLEAARDRLYRGHHLIGGRSPVAELVASQALAVENRLLGRPVQAPREAGEVRAFPATILGAGPTPADAVAAALRAGVEHLVAIPLYAISTASLVGRCRAALDDAVRGTPYQGRVAFLDGLSADPVFVDALAARARRTLDLMPPDLRAEAPIVLGAHSPPETRASRDGTLEEVEALGQALLKALERDESAAVVAWQGFGGPAEDLEPGIVDTMVERAKGGARAVLLVPLSYVVDGFETLYEMDIAAYEAAAENGVKQFRRVPSFNADATFVAILARRVLTALPPEARRRIARSGAGV